MKKAFLQLHIAIFLWGATGVLGKLIDLNEAWLVWYRFLISAISLSLLNLFLNEIQQTGFRQKLAMAFTGGLQGLHWICFFAAIKYANVSVALICLSATSFFTAILEPIIHRHKLKYRDLALGVIAILGISIIFYHDFSYKSGILFGVASAFLIAFVPVLNKLQLKNCNAPTITIWNITGGFFWVSLLLPLYVQFFPEGNRFPKTMDWCWLLVLSWFCTILTWRLSLNALKKVSAFTQNLLLNLEPVYGILLAIIFLKEHRQFDFYFYCGLSCIVVTILIQTYLVYHNAKKTSADANEI